VQESPDRVKAIKSHLEQFPNEFPILPKQVLKDFGIDPILVIHDARYVDYLRTIYQQWYCFQNAFGSCGARLRRRVGEGGNPESGVVPEMMLHKDLLPANFAPNLKHSIGKVGMHHFDLSSTVTGGNLPLLRLRVTELTCLRYMDFCLCCCSNCVDSNGSSLEISS